MRLDGDVPETEERVDLDFSSGRKPRRKRRTIASWKSAWVLRSLNPNGRVMNLNTQLVRDAKTVKRTEHPQHRECRISQWSESFRRSDVDVQPHNQFEGDEDREVNDARAEEWGSAMIQLQRTDRQSAVHCRREESKAAGPERNVSCSVAILNSLAV